MGTRWAGVCDCSEARLCSVSISCSSLSPLYQAILNPNKMSQGDLYIKKIDLMQFNHTHKSKMNTRAYLLINPRNTNTSSLLTEN